MQRQDHGGDLSASRIRAAGASLLTAHLLFVCWLTVRPRAVPWVSPPNLHPFASIRADLAVGPYAALEGIGGELLLLAPVGVLLPVTAGRLCRPLLVTATRTGLAGLLLALGLALLRSGVPGQVPNIDAVMLNTLGVILVNLLFHPPLRRWLLRRVAKDSVRVGLRDCGRREPVPPGTTPRRTRVGLTP